MSVVDHPDVAVPRSNRSFICDALVHRDLTQPASDFLERTGKRIRNSVVELVYAMAGGSGHLPPCLGEAIEWLHAGSLVIDDIQDESPMRRGLPSLHMQIGIPLALNAGNWMYFQALEKLFDNSLSRAAQNRLVHNLVRASLRCHQGQSLDLGTHVDRIEGKNIQRVVLQISRLKTGSLVSMAATFGAVAAGANRHLREALSRFGMDVGIALQMRNDLEELRSMTNHSHEFNTKRMEDLRNARITWPWAWAHSVCSLDDFAALIGKLPNCMEDPLALSRLATQLLSYSERKGEAAIQQRFDRQFCELSTHEIDDQALAEMKKVLERISNPSRELRKDADANLPE